MNVFYNVLLDGISQSLHCSSFMLRLQREFLRLINPRLIIHPLKHQIVRSGTTPFIPVIKNRFRVGLVSRTCLAVEPLSRLHRTQVKNHWPKAIVESKSAPQKMDLWGNRLHIRRECFHTFQTNGWKGHTCVGPQTLRWPRVPCSLNPVSANKTTV